MNLCFLMGKIISNIDFQFMLGSKKISIVQFLLVINEKCIVTVKAYDELADWCYQNLVKNDCIALQGELNSKMEIILHDVKF